MAYTLLSHKVAASADTHSVTTVAIDSGGASLIVLAIATYNVAAATPTDSKTNTWHPLTSKQAGTGVIVQLWYAYNPTTDAAHTFSEDVASSFPSLAVATFSGGLTTDPFDVENGATTSSAQTLATGNVTPSLDNELLVSAWGVSNPGSTNLTIDSSFNITDTNLGAGGVNVGVSLAYLVETTATLQNPAWSWTTNNEVAVVIATFKVASGAATHYLFRGS